MSDTAYPTFQHYGTNAQRTAFTPAPAAGTQPIYLWYETDTGSTYLYDTTWHNITGAGGGVTASGTLTSGKVIIGNGSSVVTVTSTTGILKGASGTLSAATDGTDYLSPSTGWTKIQTITTAASQTTVDFTSIPATYSHLRLVYISRDTAAGTGASALYLKVNNDGTAANYTSAVRSGTNNTTTITSQVSSTTSGGYIGDQPNDGNTAGITASGEICIAGYAQTTFHKRVTGENDYEISGAFVLQLTNFRWASTSAISRLTAGTAGTAFKDNSVWTLYGAP